MKRNNNFDNAYDAAFKAQANGVRFNVMDLGNVRGYVRKAVEAGTDLSVALEAAIALYRAA